MIGIGIDTGGTCTDAVIYNLNTREILASAKTLTTKSNLEIGIARVLDALPAELVRQAKNLALSTTLATNACVENKGARAKLLIIGTDPSIIARLKPVLAEHGMDDMTRLIVLDAKAENIFSEPFDPDWEELERSAPELFADCDCIGIVQTFPGANGGRFELTALRILQKALTIPVTIAYEISRETDFLKVCSSTLLNARLIPLITDFIRAVHNVMQRRSLDIPLLIVRSDGTLMSEEMARTCPVETLLCGPAASLIGGQELSGEENALVIDMGGTTTDIAMVRHSEPARAAQGISIGQFQTSIRGVDARAISLGGDTAVRFDDSGLYLDTVRIIPISILAAEHENVLPALRELAERERPHTRMIHEFYVLQKDISERNGYTPAEIALCDALRDGPLITLDLVRRIGANLYHLSTDRLEQEGVIIKSGLTPTDMMVLKGDLPLYDDLAADLMLRYVAMNLAVDPARIPDMVYEMVIRKMYRAVGGYLLEHQYPGSRSGFSVAETGHFLDAFYEQVAGQVRMRSDASAPPADKRADSPVPLVDMQTDASAPLADLRLTATMPLVGIGAPVHIFLPSVAQLLGTRAVLSPYSQVANALGAVAGRRCASLDVILDVVYEGFVISGYSVVADCRKHVFEQREDAVNFGRELAREAILKRAVFQGLGEDPQIRLSVEDHILSNGLLVEIIIHAQAQPGGAAE